jgi:rRNA-processing protein FCF1
MDRIIADTNFLLMQFEYGIDMPSELLRIASEPFTLVVPSIVMEELQALAGRNGRRATAARFALQTLPKIGLRFKVAVEKSSGPADEWIFKFAQKNRVAVATNDVPLRKRLLAFGVPIIAMKGKSKLDYV